MPNFLLMAMIALALRFTSEPFFQGRHSEVVERYSRAAWNEIFEKAFSEEYNFDIHAVQATDMLAIVDFTGEVHVKFLSYCLVTDRVSC